MHTSWDPKSPSLLPTIVCYADILGFREMTERAFKSGEAAEFLQRIKHSLATAYERMRKASTLEGAIPPAFDMKVFTDNIVVAYPLRDPAEYFGEPELGTLMMLFAEMQASLASDGFILRGAIASGDHYQDDDIAYGEALLEAVDLDKSGGPPRLVIGSSVEPLILKHLSWYSDGWAPHHDWLLEDPLDGRLFVDYLGAAFQFFPDDPIHYELLAAHSENVRRGLSVHKSNPGVRAKYKWAATYHNYICHKFADQYTVRGYGEPDPEQVAIMEEAKRVLEYLVPSEALIEEQQPPRPLDAKRLQERLAKD